MNHEAQFGLELPTGFHRGDVGDCRVLVKSPTEKYFHSLTQPLRLKGPLGEDPTARVLHALVLALAIWFGLWSIVLLPFYPNLVVRLAVAVLQEVSLVAALVLLRRGLLRQASLAYLAGTWISATFRIGLDTGIHSTILIFYVALPILATWLLGYGAALWTAGVCLGSALFFACIELAGVRFVRHIPVTPLAIWVVLVQVVLMGVVPLAQVLRTLQDTLKQSRRTQEELRRTVEQLHVEIAGRERSERALGESEQRFRVMADTAPVLIVTANANQEATFFNKAWLDFTGRTMAEELGMGWTAGVHPDDAPDCLKDLFSAHAECRECQLQYRLRRADGEYRVLLWVGVPRFEPDGSFVGSVASCIDITEFKRSQEEALARQKLESLGVLAGGIAHDFNNLLGGIMAQSELLIEELPENSSAQESVRSIDAIAIRASEVMRQLMVYAGRESAQFVLVDLADLVREMLQLVRLSISKNAVLELNLPSSLSLVNANATQIGQVIMNLLINASEALGGKEGVISLSLDEVHQDQGSVNSQEAKLEPGNYLRLAVSDTGCGMTKEVLARLFDPFFTTKAAGRGLGLSAVQGIIRSHGGTISVVSSRGQGCRFEVILPCVNQPESASPEIRKPISSDENERLTGTVLLIEDEDSLRLSVANMLRRKGLLVLQAGEGRAALDLFRAQAAQIDVVLLDVTLPGMSGREVLAELRNVRPVIKVILTSAYGRDHALETVGGEQSQPYLRKPYRLDELAEMVHRTLQRRAASGS